MSHLLRRNAGFTLLEIIVASSIAMFVFGVGYLAISSTVRASNEATARIRDAENARLFFNMLERDLKVAFPGPGNISKMIPPPLSSPVER